MRKWFVLVCCCNLISALYAEAPELQNVMPNSWRKVTKLTVAEEQAFRRDNAAALSKIKEAMNGFWRGSEIDPRFEHQCIYRQNAGSDTFYRVICTDSVNPQFLSPAVQFWQFLVYRNSLVEGGPYNKIKRLQYYKLAVYNSVDIVEGRERVKGILITELTTRKEDRTQWASGAYLKGQLTGRTESCFYPMEEIDKMINDEKYSVIRISASDCLVDPKIPLRYSLQNAFDGDPATSYVENTEDDLIEIDLTYAYYENITKIAVINGYAQNTSLYRKNNRIRKINIESLDWNDEHSYLIFKKGKEITFNDDNLFYQFSDVSLPSNIHVTNIYRGEAYNDTCLSELNLCFDGLGWLFGDIDE
jgi:hypothetical protein